MKKRVIFSLIIIALAALTVAWAIYEVTPPWKHLREQNIPCGPTNCHGFDVQCG